MKIIKTKDIRLFFYNKFFLVIYLLPFIAGFVLYYFNSNDFFNSTYSVCLFMNLTNLPCPACGMSRGFIELSHLHIIEAISYNPSIIILALLLIILIIIQLLPSKKPIYKFAIANIEKINYFLSILFILLCIFGLIRIFDKFFHFFNFKDITPSITILKFILNQF
ncbi:MAG: hypothetical protein A2086_15110 [Spirochaetes bacterium GWD1_27_9]|nr:MAG: hypothetical protein A2Z98_00125 [Spirochaetes bacterium GWB1_27_13]OHD24856.1 MAG: hypothetical protein A2Y34_08360 [Spirochaetes bacterium GWC1_27_15]OHD31093.1 MAG: hypothetical protein A2086_15110 [Spirochaetes bacterium GWD1_27_9]